MCCSCNNKSKPFFYSVNTEKARKENGLVKYIAKRLLHVAMLGTMATLSGAIFVCSCGGKK